MTIGEHPSSGEVASASPSSVEDTPASAVAAKIASPSTQPSLQDWGFLLLLMALGGSAFALIRIAVADIPPAGISCGRLWIGAVVMWIFMKLKGRKFPPLFRKSETGRIAFSREWHFMILIGITGYAIPFFLFPWGQQTIDSGLAGIYMAFMPLSTIILAHYFTGEYLTVQKIAGFIVGFAGIIVLMGVEVFSNIAGAGLVPQLAIFVAANCYSVASIFTRRAPEMSARMMITGVLLCAAIASTPFAVFYGWPDELPSAASLASVLGLGIFSTSIGGLLVIIIIRSAGAGFLSLVNYLTPIWAVVIGILLFSERLHPSALIALTIILAGVGITRIPSRHLQKLQTKIFPLR